MSRGEFKEHCPVCGKYGLDITYRETCEDDFREYIEYECSECGYEGEIEY